MKPSKAMESGMDTKQHLDVVTRISTILEEIEDSDEIYFIMRTLSNIYLIESEESRTQWLFKNALERFIGATSNREWIKNKFKFRDN